MGFWHLYMGIYGGSDAGGPAGGPFPFFIRQTLRGGVSNLGGIPC